MTDAVKPSNIDSEIEIEALACAIFQERCPGIRYLEEDRSLYEAAAKAALQVLTNGASTPAHPTQEGEKL